MFLAYETTIFFLSLRQNETFFFFFLNKVQESVSCFYFFGNMHEISHNRLSSCNFIAELYIYMQVSILKREFKDRYKIHEYNLIGKCRYLDTNTTMLAAMLDFYSFIFE